MDIFLGGTFSLPHATILKWWEKPDLIDFVIEENFIKTWRIENVSLSSHFIFSSSRDETWKPKKQQQLSAPGACYYCLCGTHIVNKNPGAKLKNLSCKGLYGGGQRVGGESKREGGVERRSKRVQEGIRPIRGKRKVEGSLDFSLQIRSFSHFDCIDHMFISRH